ncbi:MAG: hypothetical protein M3170_01380 [Candidatus Dormibacteraeota bacterium]|nr:hypothetical protein [Candidatus Dormibacteraeota bacterium]
MGRARYLVDAMVVEGRRPSDLARVHVSLEAGSTSCWPGSAKAVTRLSSPALGGLTAAPSKARRKWKGKVVRLRKELTQAGFDAGPQTILFHLQDRFQQLPSTATIWRILKRQGLVRPQPRKRPKASFIRF